MKSRIAVVAIPHPTEPNLYLHGLRVDNGKWSLPGGSAHPGETMEEAARREGKEESGLDLKSMRFMFNKQYGENDVHLFMHDVPENFKPDVTEDPDREFLTFKWLDPTTHRNLHVPASKNILVEHLKGSTVSKSEDLRKTPAIMYPHSESHLPDTMQHKFYRGNSGTGQVSSQHIATHDFNGHKIHEYRVSMGGSQPQSFFSINENNHPEGKHMSAIRVNDNHMHENEPAQITTAATAPAYQKQGLSSVLHEFAAQKYGNIESDYSLTPGANKIWHKLKANPRYKVSFGKEITPSQYDNLDGDPETHKLKVLKSELIKGAARRLYGRFDPRKELDEHDRSVMSDWVGGTNEMSREKIKTPSPAAKLRLMNKLSNRATSRFNPITKKREFLLHRQMSDYELDENLINGRINHKRSSSWTPQLSTITQSSGIYPRSSFDPTDHQSYNRIVSAWIPEGHIKTMPIQYGGHGTSSKPILGPSGGTTLKEQEVIVNPGHNSEIHAIHQDTGDSKDNWTWHKTFGKSELAKASPYSMDIEPFHSHENFDPKKHDFIVRLHHRNKPVGFMAMAHRPNGVMPFNAEIDPKHRGQNHSIAMANFASRISKKPLAQSPDMTPPAKAQWTKLQTSKLKVRKMELESYALAQELAKSTDEDYAKRASNSLALLYPVAVGGEKHRSNGVIHHISIKPFGPAEEFHPDAQDQLMADIDKYGFNQPLDAKKLRFIPHKLPAFGGGTHHVLLVSGLPPQYHRFQKDMNHIGHKIDRYLPHISIDKDMWHHLAAKGSDLSAADVGFQAFPAELRNGNQVLKTY